MVEPRLKFRSSIFSSVRFHIYLIAACAHVLSRVQLFVTPRTVAHQAPLSMGFPRQKYWSGLPFPSAGDFSDPGMEPSSLASPVLAGVFFTSSATLEFKLHKNYMRKIIEQGLEM